MTKFTKGSTQDNYYSTVLPGARKGYISEILKKFRQLVETCKSSHLIDFLMGHLKLCSLLPPFEAYVHNFVFYSENFVSKSQNS